MNEHTEQENAVLFPNTLMLKNIPFRSTRLLEMKNYMTYVEDADNQPT